MQQYDKPKEQDSIECEGRLCRLLLCVSAFVGTENKHKYIENTLQ